jgi:hypothetical protein
MVVVGWGGCQNRLPGAPVPQAISPAQANENQMVAVQITGLGFFPVISTNFKSDSQSHLNTDFLVRLGLAGVQVSLQNVALQSNLSLNATTPPLLPGVYDLTVVSPGGQSGTLPGAFTVTAVQPGCDGGDCQTTCTETQCGAECVDLATDTDHCGSCTVSCAAGQHCDGGQCACPAATPDPCTGDAGAFCTDTQTDPDHCGSCGKACSAGLACCAGGCVDTQSDSSNCLGCGIVCDTDGGAFCAADAGCVQLPAPCFSATLLDGDDRWVGLGGGGCYDSSSNLPVNDAGVLVPCGGGGYCIDDVSLDGGWYRFVSDAGHDQLYGADGGGSPGAYHCGTEESGWLSFPQGSTPLGVVTPGNVCFAAPLSSTTSTPCAYSATIAILNCGSTVVYQLASYSGACFAGAPSVGAYCTQ